MADLLLGRTVSESAPTDVTVATSDLVTHGVIVGMTGSGKTGLGVVLIEEALAAGVPALLFDPKGDLTNLMLVFPGLTGAEFEPWVDPAQAKGRRDRGPRVRREAGHAVAGRARRLGHRPGPDGAVQAVGGRLDLYARLDRRDPVEHPGLVGRAADRRPRK